MALGVYPWGICLWGFCPWGFCPMGLLSFRAFCPTPGNSRLHNVILQITDRTIGGDRFQMLDTAVRKRGLLSRWTLHDS